MSLFGGRLPPAHGLAKGWTMDDDLPLNAPKPKRDLDPMSIEELDDYILEMEEEISRVRAEIDRKRAHRADMDQLFKRPS